MFLSRWLSIPELQSIDWTETLTTGYVKMATIALCPSQPLQSSHTVKKTPLPIQGTFDSCLEYDSKIMVNAVVADTDGTGSLLGRTSVIQLGVLKP